MALRPRLWPGVLLEVWLQDTPNLPVRYKRCQARSSRLSRDPRRRGRPKLLSLPNWRAAHSSSVSIRSYVSRSISSHA